MGRGSLAYMDTDNVPSTRITLMHLRKLVEQSQDGEAKRALVDGREPNTTVGVCPYCDAVRLYQMGEIVGG